MKHAVVLAVLLALGSTAYAQPGTKMTLATGTFDVTLKPQAPDDHSDGGMLGRMTIDKVYRGDLEGTAVGQMLTAMGSAKDSGAYVAVERVTGKLHGRQGSFMLYHTGVMNRGTQTLSIVIVPDSGTDDLTGINGSLFVDIKDGKHFYRIEYALADSR